MKKWIAAILTLVMLTQALPWTALADAVAAGQMITDGELQRALQIAGMQVVTGSSDAERNAAAGGALMSAASNAGTAVRVEAKESGYHSGMDPNEAWDAQMLLDWLDDTLAREIYNVTSVFARAEMILERLMDEDPETYARLTGNADFVETCHRWAMEAVLVKDEARLLRKRVGENTVVIESNTEMLINASDRLFEYEKARYSQQIREATEALEELREDILGFFIAQMLVIITGQCMIDGIIEPEFSAWLKDVLSVEDGPQEAAVSSAAVKSTAYNTRASRLAAAERVLSNDGDQDVTVQVVDESDFAIIIRGVENRFVGGVKVTVADLNGNTVKTLVTDSEYGSAIFKVDDFVCDYDREMEVSLRVDASEQGYRSFYVPWMIIKRGSKRTETLTPLGGPEMQANSAAGAAEEWLQKNFASVNLILIDIRRAVSEYGSFIGHKNNKTFYSDIPVVLIADTDTLREAERYIGNGAVDAIRTPFEKNVVMQRLRRIIDFYGIQVERRTINLLKKSMLLRQQLNSFFEDSIAGIARVIIDKNGDHLIREVSYVNERFLKLHRLSLDSAMKADRLEVLLPNILYLEVDSFSEAVYDAIEKKSQYVSREYMTEMEDGSVKSCTAACSLLYLGDDVKLDIVILESTSGAEERAVGLISAIYAHADHKMNMRIFRYYIDDDIIDQYRKREDGSYSRELLYNARENLLTGFKIFKDSRTYHEVEEMLESLKNGAPDVEKNILMSLKGDGKRSKSWYRVSFTMLKGTTSKRCALCVIEDLAREDDYDHLIWTNEIYNRVMNENAAFYLEADLDDNRILNSEAFEVLRAYGMPEILTYDEFVKVFDMTVLEKDLKVVKEHVVRQNLIDGYEKGVNEIRFNFISKTLDVPEWREYELRIMLQRNTESGHLAVGLRIADLERSGAATELQPVR